MPVVTIRGQLGSGAPEIGRLVADELHADYVDREIAAKVAELLNAHKQDVIAKEMHPGLSWSASPKLWDADMPLGVATPLVVAMRVLICLPGKYLWTIPAIWQDYSLSSRSWLQAGRL